MSDTAIRFRDKYPKYVKYVIDPESTGVFKIKPFYELFSIWYKSGDPVSTVLLHAFLEDCKKWMESNEVELESDFTNNLYILIVHSDEVYVEMVKSSIMAQINKFQKKDDKLNQLYDIRKRIKLGNFFSLEHEDKDEIWKYVKIQIEYWENYIELEESRESSKGLRQIPHKKAILLLHYFGILEVFKDYNLNQKETAKVVADIIHRGQQNTREKIATLAGTGKDSDDDMAKTPKNLNDIIKYFDDLRLLDLAEKAKSDLEQAIAMNK